MPDSILFSIVESPLHPDFSALYRRLGLREFRFGSMRKAISALKSSTPDIVVAEFNVSNLDVFLYSLQKYSRDSDLIVMVDNAELQYVDKLSALFPVRTVLQHPVQEQDMKRCLGNRMTGD